MTRRNKYRFNARSRERLYWLEYWDTYTWFFRHADNEERNFEFTRACRRAHRSARGYARFMASAYRRRVR